MAGHNLKCICDRNEHPDSHIWKSSHPHSVAEALNMAGMANRAYRPWWGPYATHMWYGASLGGPLCNTSKMYVRWEYDWRVMSQKPHKNHKHPDKQHHHGVGADRPSSSVDLMNPCHLRGGLVCRQIRLWSVHSWFFYAPHYCCRSMDLCPTSRGHQRQSVASDPVAWLITIQYYILDCGGVLVYT
jgi:hypothetical protein